MRHNVDRFGANVVQAEIEPDVVTNLDDPRCVVQPNLDGIRAARQRCIEASLFDGHEVQGALAWVADDPHHTVPGANQMVNRECGGGNASGIR